MLKQLINASRFELISSYKVPEFVNSYAGLTVLSRKVVLARLFLSPALYTAAAIDPAFQLSGMGMSCLKQFRVDHVPQCTFFCVSKLSSLAWYSVRCHMCHGLFLETTIKQESSITYQHPHYDEVALNHNANSLTTAILIPQCLVINVVHGMSEKSTYSFNIPDTLLN
ncbi:LAME_0H14268g1_1 [Lachancea meyersii CBS 8951]|uniref:LAME_0H14268g1_1 n=1 Tax=Lachancea meyersii CBS 8951 TaxID=1266667 RepID=A0A1G4KHN0_9SACH|nr:LAME_0H14268g1_1 [Lachancea meyersii CBS 8951]